MRVKGYRGVKRHSDYTDWFTRRSEAITKKRKAQAKRKRHAAPARDREAAEWAEWVAEMKRVHRT